MHGGLFRILYDASARGVVIVTILATLTGKNALGMRQAFAVTSGLSIQPGVECRISQSRLRAKLFWLC